MGGIQPRKPPLHCDSRAQERAILGKIRAYARQSTARYKCVVPEHPIGVAEPVRLSKVYSPCASPVRFNPFCPVMAVVLIAFLRCRPELF